MSKRYQVELDRNERDFTTFLRSRDVTLSKNELRVLIASQAAATQVSLFDLNDFKNIIKAKMSRKNFSSTVKLSKKLREQHKNSIDCL